MMQQNDLVRKQHFLRGDIVISIYDEVDSVECGLFSRIDHIGNIFRYKLICTSDILLQCFPNAVHYLDCFWILLPVSLKDQRVLWNGFYNLYASIYCQLINRYHNLLCLRHFKQILDEIQPTTEDYKLLDFGCGVGLSADIFDTKKLICYDSNEKMQNVVRERGLTTINESQFRSLLPNCFDGCIACYVLHLAINTDDLIQLAHVMKHGGIIVANFYKNIHVNRVNTVLERNGLDIEQVEKPSGRFGSIYVYRK